MSASGQQAGLRARDGRTSLCCVLCLIFMTPTRVSPQLFTCTSPLQMRNRNEAGEGELAQEHGTGIWTQAAACEPSPEPVVLSLVLGRLRWSCWHPVGRLDVPEVSMMQKAAPTAKGPSGPECRGEKAQGLGWAVGALASRLCSQHSPSHACSPPLNASFKANPSSA